MLGRWLTSLTLLCFGLLSLMFIQMTKRPLCIESKVVERVDRINATHRESIFRCSYNKIVPFSEFFSQRAGDLTLRVQQIERLLESIEPYAQKVQIVISEVHPNLFRVEDHQIFIGAKLLDAPGHLEKGLAKVWYRERSHGLAVHALMEEVVTDFLLFLSRGDLDIGDPGTLVITALHKVRWPLGVKSVQGYCDSPWKKSEHFAVCDDQLKVQSLSPSQVTEVSMRSLVVTSWISSFKALKGTDRFQFVRGLPDLLRSDYLPPYSAASERSALDWAADAIRNVNLFVSGSRAIKKSEVYRVFFANLTNEFRSRGFQEAFVEAYFDVLFVSQEPISEKSPAFQRFVKMAEAHSQLQIALKDPKNLWMLPSRHPVALESFGQLRAHRTVVEKCGGYNFSYVIDYSEKTEKLLVVDHCDEKKEIEYSNFLSEGAEGFAAQNRSVTFVQFHLPSLIMRKIELSEVPNVLSFIQKRDTEDISFRSLGWQEVRWSKNADAYQPKAFIDAIEWFRVIN